MNIYCIGFLGNGGGEALKFCDSAFLVPSNITARIQESHITAGHALLQYVEDRLLLSGYLDKN
jgi:D-sedoheptulose 7-phosphate isomerase